MANHSFTSYRLQIAMANGLVVEIHQALSKLAHLGHVRTGLNYWCCVSYQIHSYNFVLFSLL